MNWYETLEGCSLQHGGQVIEPGQKILLSPEQADLHNAETAQVKKCDAPLNLLESAVTSEYKEWKANQTAELPSKTAKVKTQKPEN